MIDTWYPTPIGFYDITHEELNSVIFELDSKKNLIESNLKSDTWNDNLYCTAHSVHNILYSFNLLLTLNIIEKYSKIFFSELKNFKELSGDQSCVEKINNPSMGQSWFNYLKTFGFQNTHTHSGEGSINPYCSGVFFYDKDYVENNQYPSSISFHYNNNVFFDASKIINYNYVPGRILFFPSSLPHSVNYNKSEKVRKSISFNFYNLRH